jgi:hypothetical protein
MPNRNEYLLPTHSHTKSQLYSPKRRLKEVGQKRTIVKRCNYILENADYHMR